MKDSLNNDVFELNNEPPEDQSNYQLSQMHHFLDGISSTLTTVNSTNVIHSIYNESYNDSSVYHFTSNESMLDWLDGKSFENVFVRRLNIMDSLKNCGSQDDSTDYSMFESRLSNLNNLNPYKVSDSKRATIGGVSVYEHCDIVSICGSTLGGSKTIVGWTRNLGWINNKTTEAKAFGLGWNTFCADKNYNGQKFSFYGISNPNMGIYFMGTSMDDNIESIY